MADPYRTAALRASRRPSLYVPEENPEAVAAQEYAQSRYNELMDPYRKFKQGIIQDAYNRVLQQTGDPKQAEMAANSIAGRISRTELVGSVVAPEAALAGAGRSVGAARDLASRVMGGSRAAEAPGAMRALPPPRRNAMYPDEMLTPEVIYGTSAEGAPRLGFAKPETRYQMAVDRPAQGRPLTNYERPAIDETFVRPEDIRPFSAGNVRGTVDPLDVLAGEGGQSTEAVQLAQKIARDRAAGRAARLADEEARFAGGEGPNYAEDVLNRRRIAAGEEADFRANQLARMEEEGGGAGRQAAINNLNRQAEADFRARQMGTLDDESGAITSGRNPPQPVARALQVVERQAPSAAPAAAPAPGPGTGFIMVDSPGQGFTMTPPSRAVAMRTVGSEAAPVSAPASSFYSDPAIAAAAARKIPQESSYSGSYLPLFAGTTLAGTALLSGQQQLQDQDRSNRFAQIYGGNATSAPYSLEEANRQAAINAIRGRPEFEQGPVGSGRGAAPPSMEDYLRDRAKASASNAALDAARAQAATVPPTRPSDLPREHGPSGILSKIFGQPATTRQLFEQSQADPSDSGAWMRAERQYARTHKDEPNFDVTKLNEQGMKRGGAAGKADSVHKALEIIHHLISSR